MSNTSSNFEMTGILLGQELRKRKTPQEKIAIIQQTMEPGMTCPMWRVCMVFSPACCLSGKNNIWKEVSLLLLPERMSFLPQNWLPL
nr:IS2 repressor TnpA [Escherichia coli O104:H7]